MEEGSSSSSSPEEEQVMSEVHLGCPPRFSGPFASHFTFSLPHSSPDYDNGGKCDRSPEAGGTSAGCRSVSLDEDGDLVLTRRKKTHMNCDVSIQHMITSSIPSVGLQVWKAALVLADFILHTVSTSSHFDDITALELGAGTGLVGILLARVSRTLFLTDIGVEILDNCATNVHLNSSMFKYHEASVRVRELDWKKPWPPSVETSKSLEQQRARYSWTSSEIEEADGVSVLLAADVIYSDELTDSFFSTLESLMSRGSEKVLYLALEKRYNFSLNDLDVVANGYLCFRSFFKDEEELRLEDTLQSPCFVGKLIDLDLIPQYIKEYDRGKDVELWEITYVTAGKNL